MKSPAEIDAMRQRVMCRIYDLGPEEDITYFEAVLRTLDWVAWNDEPPIEVT